VGLRSFLGRGGRPEDPKRRLPVHFFRVTKNSFVRRSPCWHCGSEILRRRHLCKIVPQSGVWTSSMIRVKILSVSRECAAGCV